MTSRNPFSPDQKITRPGAAEIPAPAPWQAAADRLIRALSPAGLDLIHPFDADRFEAARRLIAPERPGALALLVGNTRRLWAPFSQAPRDDPHPLDRYVERAVRDAAAALDTPALIRFAHRTDPAFPFQRLADAAGFAALSPCHLNIHPQHGPWIALRALLILPDLDAPPPPTAPAPSPCAACHAPCLEPFDRALRAADTPDVPAHWPLWLAVRDACPVGRDSRYTDAQITYHYTHALPPCSP